MTHWNYRVINHKDYYGLHEVHYGGEEEIIGYTEDPVVVGDTVEEIKHALIRMLSCVEEREVIDG